MPSKAIVCSLLCLIVCCSPISGIPVVEKFEQNLVDEPSSVTLNYDAGSNKLIIGPDGSGSPVASANFSNKINETGWSYLQVETYVGFPDFVQAYSAGVIEGLQTKHLVQMHWQNTMAGFCTKPYSKFCAKLSAFLTTNLQWMKEQISKNPNSPFWHQVMLFLYQAAGLADSINGHLPLTINDNIDPMSFYLFQVDGDIEDLESVLSDSEVHRTVGAGSCSALIKLLAGSKDLYTSQVTWNAYQSMLRVLKYYDFPWATVPGGEETIPGRYQTFSSYPGTLYSGDDFYTLSSGMVSMETTIGNSNSSRWQYVTSSSVLEGIRTMVANRLARSGQEWATTFSMHNSGTYNNEWMVVDYKQFKPGMSTQPPGVLTVLDQIPGMIKWADVTHLLNQQGYFPSYNIPYFPDIFNASGNQANVKKYGDWFTYDKAPRALIFKRDHVKVKDLDSMTRLMRYNDFKHDPLARCNCTPPYSGENAISARSDLNPKDGKYPFGALGHRNHGGTDMKLTASGLMKDLTFIAVGGPTWDQQPPFQWSTSDFNSTSHIGQPDLWKFTPIAFNVTQIFGLSTPPSWTVKGGDIFHKSPRSTN